MKDEQIIKTGIVCRIESKDVYVLIGNDEYRCSLRGKLKLETEFKQEKYIYKDVVIVGDYVEVEIKDNFTGVINKIPNRKNYISRKAPKIKGLSLKGRRTEQIIAANIDQVLCVSSIDKPVFNNRVIDRLIVISESCGATPIIVINKIDLDEENLIQEWVELYTDLGYEVILTSTQKMIGIDRIKNIIENKSNLLLGHSGVGKSSLVNLLGSGINQKVGEISEAWKKGRHTTVTSILFRIKENTYIIDTPGIKEIEPYGLTAKDITHYFHDIEQFAQNCKFNTCTHHHEPGCMVKEAIENGELSMERYISYLRLIETLEEDDF